MEAANASVYDAASACVEAIAMALRIKKRHFTNNYFKRVASLLPKSIERTFSKSDRNRMDFN